MPACIITNYINILPMIHIMAHLMDTLMLEVIIIILINDWHVLNEIEQHVSIVKKFKLTVCEVIDQIASKRKLRDSLTN